MSKPIEGTFRRHGKGWEVLVDERAPLGAEVIVQKRSEAIKTVVIVGEGRRSDRGPASRSRFYGRGYLYPFADLGTMEAEKAKAKGGDAGLRRLPGKQKKKRAKPTPAADFKLIRPRGCVGGMSRERALVDARTRGPGWVTYQCDRCGQHHVREDAA